VTAAAAITTRTFSSADQGLAGRAPAGWADAIRLGFDFFFDTPATLPAARNHRDKVA
jgi:hypothetical protein